MSRVVLVLSLLTAASLLAGCVEESAPLEPFASLAAPQWEAGHTWTWQAHQSGTWTYSSLEGSGTSSGTESREIVHTVVNTVETALDTPVYWIRASERIDTDGPIDDGLFGHQGLQALAKNDLQPVAYARDDGYLGGFHDACAMKTVSLYPADPFPYLRFPLERGATWQGELEDHITMEAEVLGAREIAVPAGTFDAVEVRIEVEVDPEFFAEQDEVQSISASTSVWYAEAVRNIVRLESDMEVHFVEGEGEEGSMVSDTVIELVSFAHVAGAEEDLPPVRPAFDPYKEAFRRPMPALSVATNTTLPLNAATDPLEVTFGLTDATAEVMEGADGIVRVETLETAPAWLDSENQTVEWGLLSRNSFRYQVVTGPTATFVVPPGGAFELQARLVPKVDPSLEPAGGCVIEPVAVDGPSEVQMSRAIQVIPRSYPAYHLASGRFAVEWHQAFQQTHEGLQQATYELGEVPLEFGAYLVGTYESSAREPVGDLGHLRVVFANGDSARLDGSGLEISSDRVGVATIEWVAQARFAGVTLGHEVEGTIAVTY